MFSWSAINSNLLGTFLNIPSYTYIHTILYAGHDIHTCEGLAEFQHLSFDGDVVGPSF